MQVTRRSLLRGAGTAGAATFLWSLFPEFSMANPATGKSSDARKSSAIAIAKKDKRLAKVLSTYPGYQFQWDVDSTVVGEKMAWVNVVGSRKAQKKVVFVHAAMDLATSKVLLVEHATIGAAPATSSNVGTLRIAFDDKAHAWEGEISRTRELVPDAGYPDVSGILASSQPEMTPASTCTDAIGDICALAAGGDSVLACAVLVETVGGAIACGLALLIISVYGCAQLRSMICD
jgi:hypothetical protein